MLHRSSRPRPAGLRPRLGLQSVGWIVSALLVGAVVWWALRQPAPELPTAPSDLAALAGAIALYAAVTLVRGERWRLLLEDSDASVGRTDAWCLTVVGYAGNNVLPARGGDVMRVVLGAAQGNTSRRAVVGTLVAERLLDVVILAAIFLVLALTIAGGAGLPSGRTLAILLAAGAGVLLAAGGVVAWLVRRGAWQRVKAFLVPMAASTRSLRGRHGGRMLGLTIVIWAIEAAVWGTVGASANLGMGPLDALYLVSLASMFSLIPSGPGYAGTQDAAALIGVRAIGGSSAIAVTYLILVRFVLLVPITLAGLLLLATRYGGLTRWRTA
ncbi:MAG: flippase-like domain-containing protein [Actinomycetota bacterium]|nr:flippase-like domain-containing protein [Actinomycetota bacterium]